MSDDSVPSKAIARARDAVASLRRLALGAAMPLAALAQPSDPSSTQPPPPAEPRWEAGIAAGAGRVSDYPGSDQAHVRGIVVPVVIYRGPVLRVDREGIRGQLFGRPDLELDLAATAAFDARDSDARAGMPGLDYLFGIGPQVVWRGRTGVPGRPSLHAKLHAIVSTDFRHVDGRGFVFAPELRWRRRAPGDPSGQWTFGVQPSWASRPLMRYFYDVAPSQARPGRPAYEARAGYLGTELKLTYTRRVDASWSWFVAVRALSLHGAANRDSPLLRSTSNLSFGGGVVWTPWRSGAVVQGE